MQDTSYGLNRVLVLGASGMLGNAVLRFFAQSCGFDVFGTVRSPSSLKFFSVELQARLLSGVDVENVDNLLSVFRRVQPHVVVNCVGLIKQLEESGDALSVIPINALLPHRLAKLCEFVGARLLHISTDCVFSGSKGMYVENDSPDAKDFYGRSKLLGETISPNSVTLRTSIIGHELSGFHSLLSWFIAQTGQVSGYRKAVFSGLPSVEIARVIRDYVLPNSELSGLYHLSAEPISKYDLLKLIALEYGKKIDIRPDDSVVIDRSLDSSRFRGETTYNPPSWPELIRAMRKFS